MQSDFGSITTHNPDDCEEENKSEHFQEILTSGELIERYKNHRNLKKFLSQDNRTFIKKFHQVYEENRSIKTTKANKKEPIFLRRSLRLFLKTIFVSRNLQNYLKNCKF
jgi:hypothetical protein